MKKKKIMILSISILLGVFALIGTSYALFSIVVTGEKVHTMKSAKLELSFIENSNGISLTNAYPAKDEDGMKTTSYTFTLKNTGSLVSSYNLSLEDQSITGERMPDSVIKYYLKKDTIEPEPKLLTNRVLDVGYIYPNESIVYELKVWMDYDAGNEVQGMKFNTKVKTEGVQVGKPTDESCFTFSNGTITAYDYNCTKNIVIPKTINSVAVTAIGSNAFQNWEITENGEKVSVVFPNGITTIGDYAFDSIWIDTIVLPDSVISVGEMAFENCGIKKLVLSNNLKQIGANAFEINNLNSLNLPSSLTSIGSYTFSQGSLIQLNIPEGVTTVKDGAFSMNKLTNVSIPESITTIEMDAFARNQLMSITIPSSVTTIGNNALGENNNLNIIYNKTGKSFDWGNITGSGSSQSFVTGTVTHPNGNIKVLDGKATDTSCFTFSNGTITAYSDSCTKDVVIPEKLGGTAITTIGERAFSQKDLTSVLLPETITTIGVRAFQYNQFQTIVLPKSTKVIAERAFVLGELESVSLNEGLEEMGIYAFSSNKIKSITFPKSLTTIAASSFGTNEITKLVIPEHITSIGQYAFYHNPLTKVTIKGKKSSSDFISYPSPSPFQWADGYSDSNITWNG